MDYDFDTLIERRGTTSIKWGWCDEDVLPMWVADMDFRSPPAVLEALRDALDHGIFGYAAAPAGLREVLVARMATLYQWAIEPDWLVFIPGVVPAFNLACRALARPGDGVLIQTPVYGPIYHVSERCGLERHVAPLYSESESYHIDFDAFRAAIRPNTRLFLLCNPHNPTGRVFTREELLRMADLCLERDLLIISDEIHCDIIYPGHQHLPIAALDPRIAQRSITLMAPSKTFNIAGLYASVAIIPNPELRRRYQALRQDLVPAVNMLGYIAMLAAYRDGEDWRRALLRYLEANRDAAIAYIRARWPQVRLFPPEGTFLLWMDWRALNLPVSPYDFFLERARVMLNRGEDFGPEGAGFTRLNFGCPRARLEEALSRMDGALQRGW